MQAANAPTPGTTRASQFKAACVSEVTSTRRRSRRVPARPNADCRSHSRGPPPKALTDSWRGPHSGRHQAAAATRASTAANPGMTTPPTSGLRERRSPPSRKPARPASRTEPRSPPLQTPFVDGTPATWDPGDRRPQCTGESLELGLDDVMTIAAMRTRTCRQIWADDVSDSRMCCRVNEVS